MEQEQKYKLREAFYEGMKAMCQHIPGQTSSWLVSSQIEWEKFISSIEDREKLISEFGENIGVSMWLEKQNK